MPRNAPTTRRTYSCTSSAAVFNASSMYGSTPGSGPPRRPRQPQLGIAQAFDVVANSRGLFEVEVLGGLAHFDLSRREVGVEFRLGLERLGAVLEQRRRGVVPFVDARHHVVDLLDDRLRCDAMLLVVGLLNRAPPVGFVECCPHRSGHGV